MAENNQAAANDFGRQPAFSPILCLAIGAAIGFFAFLGWLLLTAFG
jgi:hypothetical protein